MAKFAKPLNKKRVHKRLKALIPFVKASRHQRKKLLKQNRVVSCFCEIAHNVLKGNVQLSPRAYQRWKRHRKDLRTLTAAKATYKTKRRTLQKGGFLNLLLPLASTLLGGLFAR